MNMKIELTRSDLLNSIIFALKKRSKAIKYSYVVEYLKDFTETPNRVFEKFVLYFRSANVMLTASFWEDGIGYVGVKSGKGKNRILLFEKNYSILDTSPIAIISRIETSMSCYIHDNPKEFLVKTWRDL